MIKYKYIEETNDMDNIKIHFLNTIWSDAIILEKDNHYAFIDAATDFYYPMIQKHLKDFNIDTIDFIVLTHFHSDHYDNIVNLINDYKRLRMSLCVTMVWLI